MRPVKTDECNMVYKGPTPDIGDLHCQRVVPGEIRSFWRPTRNELEVLNAGGLVTLSILSEPIPPVSLSVSTSEEVH